MSCGGKEYTIQEERELALIEKGLQFNSDMNKWVAEYPWIRSPDDLPNNFTAAFSRLISTEKRLMLMGEDYSLKYLEQIHDMVNRQIARKLSKEDLVAYKGPVHYVPHHEIHKPDSESTPLRIVFNSSASFMGHALNNYWAKGPNVVNDLISVLTRFRQGYYAFVGDISKMYNSIAISERDQHTHRFLWRDLNANREPDNYVLQAVTFGDKPSGTIAMVALKLTADTLIESLPGAAMMIKQNSYVDDILQSVASPAEAEQLARDAEQILSYGGFPVKHCIGSHINSSVAQERVHFVEKEEEKVLGMRWQPESDTFRFKATLKFSKKIKGVRVALDMHQRDIPHGLPQKLTRRMLLSQVASIFDPLGLISPFVLQAKYLMRELCKEKVDPTASSVWDKPVSDDIARKWAEFFRRLFEVERICFPRCVKPQNARGDPVLVMFSDGSSIGYGAVAYARWEIADNVYDARIVMAKNRIAPVRELTIPRLELCGAIIAARIRAKLQRDMDWTFAQVIHIVDSMIVRAQIQKESYGFGTFVATRVAEIQAKTKPSEWHCVPSCDNVADLTTRQTNPHELGMNSKWQCGPEFIRRPVENWPIRQDCEMEVSDLPDTCTNAVILSSEATCVPNHENEIDLSMIDFDHFNDWDSLIRVVGILLIIAERRTFKGITSHLTPEVFERAEHQLVKYAQLTLPRDWRYRYRQLGVDLSDDGIIVVGTRMQEWIKRTWNRTLFSCKQINQLSASY